MKTEKESISGIIESVVYTNPINDYAVIDISDKDNNLVTAVGTMAMPSAGEKVVLHGEWCYHKEFGKQFSFDAFEKKLPEEIDGILQYLSSKTVKGVGPVTALKIVNVFGKDTFDVLENHPEWLADIPGITMKKAAVISQSFKEQAEIRGVMMFCGKYMDKSEITKVYKQLGSGAIGIIKENPYILCGGEFGISFLKADEIAKDFGEFDRSIQRILAGFEHVLSTHEANNGDTCLPKDILISDACGILGIEKQYLLKMLDELIGCNELSEYFVDNESYISRNEMAEAEEFIAKRISEMERQVKHFSTNDIQNMIDRVEQRFGIRYANLQRRAIYEALNGSAMILTGGPGTGKTTVVRALLSIFDSIGLKTVLCAPTGRAAKRLSEATGNEAKTIHRMLEMERTVDGYTKFNRNSAYPIDEHVVIIDEASMIDVMLMASVFKALKRGARIILIGDIDQLPSVGAGNVLSDFIESNKITTVRLREIFRQDEESLIVINAFRINNGESPVLNDTKSDFFFVCRENESDIPSTITSLISERLPKTYGISIKDDIQVISPSKKGQGGTVMLNTVLQNSLNPPKTFKKEIKSGTVTFRVGDKVMQTTNDYDIEWERGGTVGTGVFNGDIGIIENVSIADEKITVRFDERVAEYSFDKMGELELAYAITVHKSQGSEYPVVIMPVYSCAPMLQTRNLFYTAITRARRMVILVGRSDIPHKMVSNNMIVKRYTTLKSRILSFS